MWQHFLGKGEKIITIIIKIHGRLSLKSFFTLLLVLQSPSAANDGRRERAAEAKPKCHNSSDSAHFSLPSPLIRRKMWLNVDVTRLLAPFLLP